MRGRQKRNHNKDGDESVMCPDRRCIDSHAELRSTPLLHEAFTAIVLFVMHGVS